MIVKAFILKTEFTSDQNLCVFVFVGVCESNDLINSKILK